jgi:hypothetical protein
VTQYIPKHIFSRELEPFNVNVGGLRRFYKSDHAAQMVLDGFAGRQNDKRITTVSSVVSTLTGASLVISPREVIEVFMALQTFNCGDYISGVLLALTSSNLDLSGELALSVFAGQQLIRREDNAFFESRSRISDNLKPSRKEMI